MTASRTTKVALVRCSSYEEDEVLASVERAVALLGGIDRFVPNVVDGRETGPVLLKPNMLSPSAPEKAVTTHPSIVYAVAKMYAEAGFHVQVGDSPGSANVTTVASVSGIGDAARKAGAALVSFEQARTLHFPQGLVSREFAVGAPQRFRKAYEL